MSKNKKEAKQDYTVPSIVAVAVLTVLVMVLGWLIAHNVNPPGFGDISGTAGPDSDRNYLVYRSYKVTSRGDDTGPNDDSVSYEFFRYPLDGSAMRGESIIRIDRENEGKSSASPWMKKISDDTMLFSSRDSESKSASWIDVSGNELRSTDGDSPPDAIWGGIPSPNGGRIAYYDWPSSRIKIFSVESGQVENHEAPTENGLLPVTWKNSNELYLKAVTESGLPVAGLWLLNTDNGDFREMEAINDLNLYVYDIDSDAGRLVGTTFTCTNYEDCGSAPSALHLVDLSNGKSVELFSDKHLIFERPRISPDAKQVAYTITNSESDVWVSDLDVAGHNRRVISGKLLDWTPDGNWLVVDRDNEIQLVSVDGQAILSVARRSGKYPDADFHGIDYIGIVSKN